MYLGTIHYVTAERDVSEAVSSVVHPNGLSQISDYFVTNIGGTSPVTMHLPEASTTAPMGNLHADQSPFLLPRTCNGLLRVGDFVTLEKRSGAQVLRIWRVRLPFKGVALSRVL